MAQLRCPRCRVVSEIMTKDSRPRGRGLVRTRSCSKCGYNFLTIEKLGKKTLIELEQDKEPQICREKDYAEIFRKERWGIVGAKNEDNYEEE